VEFDVEMMQQLAQVDSFLDKGDIKRADVAIAKLLRSSLSSQLRAHTLLRRARARLLSARPEEAIDDLLAAQSIVPAEFESPALLELLADCYFARFELASMGFADRGDRSQAQQIYEHILEHFPKYDNLGWIHYQLGRILLASNHTPEAAEHFQAALLSPGSISGLTAFCYERLGFIAFYEWRDPEKALGLLNRAVDTYPSASEQGWMVQVHILRSRVLRAMSNYGGALAAAETALNVAYGSGQENRRALTEALLMVGELLSELDGRERDVIYHLQQFVQAARRPPGVDVTWSRVYEMLGNAYFKIGQYDNAIVAYRSVLQFNPDYPWETSLYYRIARCYYQQRAYVEAVETVHQILKAAKSDNHDVNEYRVYDILGSAEFALGHYQKASEAYQKALQLAPGGAENIDKIRTYLELAQQLI
jgi:tetratricopeptide (TPR) repeat protein